MIANFNLRSSQIWFTNLIMKNERKIKDLYHIIDELVHIRDTINFPKQYLLNRFNATLEDIQKHNNLLDNNKKYWDKLLNVVDNQRQI